MNKKVGVVVDKHKRFNKKKFPMLAVFLLVFASFWLLNELRVIDIKLPWIPIALIIIAVGMIFNRYFGGD